MRRCIMTTADFQLNFPWSSVSSRDARQLLLSVVKVIITSINGARQYLLLFVCDSSVWQRNSHDINLAPKLLRLVMTFNQFLTKRHKHLANV